jgi:hypothetical protein
MRLTLLGPQRQPTVDQVARELEPDAPLATVTAGWQEREPDDEELDRLLGGRSVNLGLYGRWLDVQERDGEYAAAELSHRALLDELRLLHLVQLEAALAALHTLTKRSGDGQAAIETALADAEAVVRLIDHRHAERLRDAHEEFAAAFPPDEREVITDHRTAVRKILEQATGLVVTGGHVGVLLRLLRLFRVADAVPPNVVAWSAGAMTLTERVVLFHDRTPQGPSPVEIYDHGLGLLADVVLLPDARRRLLVDDPGRMAELFRRFAPATCVVLDQGARLDFGAEPAGDSDLPAGARIIGSDGRILAREAS